MQPITLTLLCFLYFCTTHAQVNVTVDNTSALWNYQGPWTVVQAPGYDWGGSHQLIDVDSGSGSGSSATASLTFTGTAVYYWAPYWPYEITTWITLDDETPVVLKMTDSSNGLQPVGSVGPTIPSTVQWSRTGLSNTQHTITMSLVPQNRYIVVDAVSYTAPQYQSVSAIPLPSGSSTSSLTTSASSTAASSGSAALIATGVTVAGSGGSGSHSSPTQSSPNDPHSSSPSSSTGQMDPASGTSNRNRSVVLVAVTSAMGALLGIVVIAILLFLLCRRQGKRKASNGLSPFLVDQTEIPIQSPPLTGEKAGWTDSHDRSTSSTPMPLVSSIQPSDEKIAPPENPVPSTSTPSNELYPSSSLPDNPIFAHHFLRRSILSDHGSIAYTTAPPPYRRRESNTMIYPVA